MADKNASSSLACRQRVLLGQRDQLLHQPLNFLPSVQRGVDVAVANELALQVGKQRTTLVARKAKFSSIYLMIHVFQVLGIGFWVLGLLDPKTQHPIPNTYSEIIIILVIERVERAIATLRWLELETVLDKLVADFQ